MDALYRSRLRVLLSGRLRIHAFQGTGRNMCSLRPVHGGGTKSGLYRTAVGHILQTCGDHRDSTAVGLGLVIHGAKNNIDILSGKTLDKVGRVAGIRQRDITGHIEYDICSNGLSTAIFTAARALSSPLPSPMPI